MRLRYALGPPPVQQILNHLAWCEDDELIEACRLGEEWCAHVAAERFKHRGGGLNAEWTEWRYDDPSFIDWERRMSMLAAIRVAARKR